MCFIKATAQPQVKHVAMLSFDYLGELKQFFIISCLICILAPDIYSWSAYLHCKLAEVSAAKDCGCESILSPNSMPGDHSNAIQLVKKRFNEREYLETTSISADKQWPADSLFTYMASSGKILTGPCRSIFRPPAPANT